MNPRLSESAEPLVEPLQLSTIVEVLHHRADHSPDAPAFAAGGEVLTYASLRDEAVGVASALVARGVLRGERCAILLPTGLDFVRALFAVQALGAAPVPINPSLPAEQAIRRIEQTRCGLAIVSEDALQTLCGSGFGVVAMENLRAEATGEALPSSPQPDDPAVFISTSGTSGESCAAVVLHRNLMASVLSGLKRLEIRPGDVLVNWVPLYHGLGLVRFIFCPLFFGCPVHFVQPTIAHLQTWLKTIARVRGTITGAPDFAFRAANEIVNPDGLDLSSLRFAISSGEAIRFETIQRFEKKFGLPGVIRPVYGLSESNGVTGVAPGEPLRTDAAGNVCCGKPVHGMELEVVDENGIAQPAGKPGEIRLRGPQVFTGYFENEEATRKKLRDGWLYTGDMGTRDGEGNLYVVGRVRSLIKRGGAMLAPRDVELPAERVAGVVGSAAFGVVRNALLGSEDVILAAEIGEKEIASEIERARIAREITEQISHALGFGPTEIVLVPAQKIPRTSNGKVRHEEVKRLFSAGDFTRSEAFVFGRGSAG